MLIYILYYVVILIVYSFSRRYTFRFRRPTAMATYYESEIGGEEDKDKKRFLYLAIGLMVLIMGLRAQTMGVDLRGYLASFETLNEYSWKEILGLESYLNYERGYIIFNKLVGSIWCNRQFFLFVCAAISIIPVGIVIYKCSPDPLLSIIIYIGLPVFLLNYSGLRQAIAIGILILSFEFMTEKTS